MTKFFKNVIKKIKNKLYILPSGNKISGKQKL